MNNTKSIYWQQSYYLLISLIFCISIVLSQLFPVVNDLKYLVCGLYLIFPLINGDFVNINQFSKILIHLLIFWTIFFIFHILVSTSNEQFINRSFKEYIFISLPLVSVIIACNYLTKRKLESIINSFLWSLLLLETIRNGFNIDILINPLDFIIYSNSETESTYALLYGLLVIHYFSKKDILRSLISLYLVFIGGKRIVILSLILILIFFYLVKFLLDKKKITFIIFLIANLLVTYLLIGLANGKFDAFISDITGFSIHALAMGRPRTYSIVLSSAPDLQLVGKGLGYSSYLLEKVNSGLLLMHSDVLKLYFETGIIGLVFFIKKLSVLARISSTAFVLVIYYNLLMVTENQLIYIQVSLMFYFLLFYEFLNNDN